MACYSEGRDSILCVGQGGKERRVKAEEKRQEEIRRGKHSCRLKGEITGDDEVIWREGKGQK